MDKRTFKLLSGLCLLLVIGSPWLGPPVGAADGFLPIGEIQGSGAVSPYLEQRVAFNGIVTGMYEDQNQRGAIFYTVFVQDIPGTEDGDPATSDAIPVFLAASRPSIAIGDEVTVEGEVTEFYGLSEISHRGVIIRRLSSGNPLPEPVILQPPADDDEAAAVYYESLEGMRVTLDGPGRVVGPTYSGCGFAVVTAGNGLERVLRHQEADPVGQVIPVLHNSDADCEGFPDVSSGDLVDGLVGPLTYSFDQFRIVQQEVEELEVTAGERPPAQRAPAVAGQAFMIATFNVENYFDTIDDTGDDAEPKPTADELAIKQAKLTYALAANLGCPALVAIQEVENEPLLHDLAHAAAPLCDFTYQVTHRESADVRGIDVALLSDPRRVTIIEAALRQGCTAIETGIVDDTLDCSDGQEPLFSRPPLQVAVLVDQRPFTIIVNHFKSKRGDAVDTAARRLAQARHINRLVESLLNADDQARIIVLGDFNDYAQSPPLQMMTKQGQLTNVLMELPPESRYSFIFNGVSQLIDGILISPALAGEVVTTTILHVNADYPEVLAEDISSAGLPYRTTDHDLPLLVLRPAAVEDDEVAGAAESPATEPTETIESMDTIESVEALEAETAVMDESLPVRETEVTGADEPLLIKEVEIIEGGNPASAEEVALNLVPKPDRLPWLVAAVALGLASLLGLLLWRSGRG